MDVTDNSPTTEIEAAVAENLFDESYEREIIVNKRTFYLNRLDRTDINERWVGDFTVYVYLNTHGLKFAI